MCDCLFFVLHSSLKCVIFADKTNHYLNKYLFLTIKTNVIMKKLLLSVLAVLSVVSVNAFQKDDYLYTMTAKFKVTGDNVVTNGDFANATTGWTNQEGAEVSALSWQYTPGAGPNGEAALMSLNADEGNVLARTFELTAGKYSISYWIKGGDAGGTTANSSANANYAGVFVNNDASLTTVVRQVNDQATFTTEWSQIVDTVDIASGEYLVMYFDKMAANTMVTGFEIHEIKEVYDTRKLEYEVNFAKELLAQTEYFVNGVEDFQMVVGALEEAIVAPSEYINTDDVTASADFIENEWKPALQAFLAANSADAMSKFTHWYDGTKGQKLSSKGSWVLPSGRWFHCNNVYTEEEMQRIYNQIQGTYDMPEADAYVQTQLAPGTYMLSMDIKGFYYAGSAADVRYTPNYNSTVKGVTLYGNADSVKIDVLPTTAYKRYTVFFKIDTDSANNAKFGIEHVFDADMVGKKLGGEVSLSNVYFRQVGLSQEDFDLITLVGNIATQQNALKVMIDSAKTVTAKTAEYPWGMEVLVAAIAPHETFLNDTYAKYVDAAGNNIGTTLADEAMPDSIMNAMRAMRTSIQNLYALNQPNKDIVEAIAYHRGVIVDALFAGATASSRAAYETSIADAEALYKTLGTLDSIAGAAEAVKYNDAIALMETKELAFKESCASYAAPAPKAVKNADMRNGGTGKPSKNSELKDWDSVFDTANGWKSGEKWNYADLSKYGIDGCAVQYWRGYTASPQGQTSQQITLTDAGVYEFEAYTYGNNENSKGRGYYTPVTDETSGLTVDTLFDKSGLKIFFGLSGIEDSIRVHSQYSEDGYKPSKKTVTYIKAADGDETFAFGFHSTTENISGSGCNYIGFGPVRLLYGGATDVYLKDLEADVTETVAKAQAMVDANKDKEAYTWLTTKLERYIKDAQEARLPWMGVTVDAANQAKVVTAKRNAIINMNLTMDRLTTVITGIEGVEAETVLDANAKGVYSITGVKLGNELKGLQKGLYIINGKKYIVK